MDQLVREIKARIAQRHGIDLSAGQIQELAARRLEAILDPRTIKPSLLEQLRRSAGAPADVAPVDPTPAFTFEDHTIFDTHNGPLRVIRRLLQPILKLFFNPNPIAHALNAQARLNKELAVREDARERTQAEWNALHYTLLQRVVMEISRVSIEAQQLALKVEALSARVDFYERRVRGLENTAQPAAASAPSSNPTPTFSGRPAPPGDAPASGDGGDGARKRRRRRRGRRAPGGVDLPQGTAGSAGQAGPGDDGMDDGPDSDFDGSDAESSAGSSVAATPSQAAPSEGSADTRSGARAPDPAPAADRPAATGNGGETGPHEAS